MTTLGVCSVLSLWVFGIKLRLSGVCDKCFSHGAISSAVTAFLQRFKPPTIHYLCVRAWRLAAGRWAG